MIANRHPRRRSMTTAEFQARYDRRDDMRQKPRKPLADIMDVEPQTRSIHKSQLLIDPSYQRDPAENAVKSIAAKWSWRAAGALLVARRPDGEFYCFDGGTRLAASKRREDVQTIPCLIWDSSGPAEEAKAFLVVNSHRNTVTAIQKFRAQLTMQDEEALLLDGLLEAAGYAVAPKPAAGRRQTNAISALMKAIHRGREAFERVWPLLLDVAAGGPIADVPVQAVCHVERHMAKTGDSLASEPWRTYAVRLGTTGITMKARALAGYEGKGGMTVFARSLVDAINDLVPKGEKKLVIPSLAKGNEGLDDDDEEDAPGDGGKPAPAAAPPPTLAVSTATIPARPQQLPFPVGAGQSETMANCGADRLPTGSVCASCRKAMVQEPTYYVRSGNEERQPGTVPVWCVTCSRATTKPPAAGNRRLVRVGC